MDEKTLTALQGSIKKWEEIVAGTATDEGEDNCPLCQLFLWQAKQAWCTGCPVAEHAKEPGCNGTPYRTWADHHVKNGNAFKVSDEETKGLAQAELDFLRSLLPPAAGERK